MPAAQSTTPDYYVKSGVASALIQDDAFIAAEGVPSWATTATLFYRSKQAASGSGNTIGAISIGGGTLSVTLDTTGTDLAVGLYDAEWEFTDSASQKIRLPADRYLLLEVVEKIQ